MGTELQRCGVRRVLETDVVMVARQRNVLYANVTVSTVIVCCQHIPICKQILKNKCFKVEPQRGSPRTAPRESGTQPGAVGTPHSGCSPQRVLQKRAGACAPRRAPSEGQCATRRPWDATAANGAGEGHCPQIRTLVHTLPLSSPVTPSKSLSFFEPVFPSATGGVELDDQKYTPALEALIT